MSKIALIIFTLFVCVTLYMQEDFYAYIAKKQFIYVYKTKINQIEKLVKKK